MITALILAAGQSKRMGRPKMLLPWGETTVVVPNTKLANSILTNNYYPDLSVRVYRCPECGHTADRDTNAASNCAQYAVAVVETGVPPGVPVPA